MFLLLNRLWYYYCHRLLIPVDQINFLTGLAWKQKLVFLLSYWHGSKIKQDPTYFNFLSLGGKALWNVTNNMQSIIYFNINQFCAISTKFPYYLAFPIILSTRLHCLLQGDALWKTKISCCAIVISKYQI